MTNEEAIDIVRRFVGNTVRSEVSSVTEDCVYPGEPERMLKVTLYFDAPVDESGKSWRLGSGFAQAVAALGGLQDGEAWPKHRSRTLTAPPEA